jgi:uncharacterized protein YutE (UPF0331/DUF86 family)
MTPLDREVLAERVAAVERHLARVAERLPPDPSELRPGTDASDAVILHLWQAVQIVLDLALATCVHVKMGTPSSYADAFALLEKGGCLDGPLADRLRRAAAFRNVIAHSYEKLDLERVHRAALEGPNDLRAFMAVVRDLV